FKPGREEDTVALVQACHEFRVQLGELVAQVVVLGALARRPVAGGRGHHSRLLAVVTLGFRRGVALHFNEPACRAVAVAELVEEEVAGDRQEIVLVGVEAVVAVARRLLESAGEGLLDRVVEVERLLVAGEAEVAAAALEAESALKKVCDLWSIVAIDLLERGSLSG